MEDKDRIDLPEYAVSDPQQGIADEGSVLTIATIRNGIIVFMEKDEKTMNAAIQAVITSQISDLQCGPRRP